MRSSRRRSKAEAAEVEHRTRGRWDGRSCSAGDPDARRQSSPQRSCRRTPKRADTWQASQTRVGSVAPETYSRSAAVRRVSTAAGRLAARSPHGSRRRTVRSTDETTLLELTARSRTGGRTLAGWCANVDATARNTRRVVVSTPPCKCSSRVRDQATTDTFEIGRRGRDATRENTRNRCRVGGNNRLKNTHPPLCKCSAARDGKVRVPREWRVYEDMAEKRDYTRDLGE